MAQKPTAVDKLPPKSQLKDQTSARIDGGVPEVLETLDSLSLGAIGGRQLSSQGKKMTTELREPVIAKNSKKTEDLGADISFPENLSAARAKAFANKQAFFFVDRKISDKIQYVEASEVVEEFESDALPKEARAFYAHRFSERVFCLGKADQFDSKNHPLLTYIFQANVDDFQKKLFELHENFEARAVCCVMFRHGVEVEKDERVAADFLSTIRDEARPRIFGRVLFYALDEGNLDMVTAAP